MAPRTINPDPASLQIEAIYPSADAITISLRTCRPEVSCPDCDQPTEQVHSWYQRAFTDLPWQGLAVRFRLHTRRWRCSNPACLRQIFTERLPDVVAPFARHTLRLAEVVDAIAFALGGEAGARVLATLGPPVSPDTLLNRVRAVEVPASPAPRVIGIDDWAWRKGNRYGTIIVDLERHRVIELLPDREVETIVTWLRQHPDIEVIARDRGDTSIAAASIGAPKAQQVADRWHLLKNLAEAVEASLLPHRAALRAAAEALDPDTQPAAAPLEVPDSSSGPIMPNRPRLGLQQQVAPDNTGTSDWSSRTRPSSACIKLAPMWPTSPGLWASAAARSIAIATCPRHQHQNNPIAAAASSIPTRSICSAGGRKAVITGDGCGARFAHRGLRMANRTWPASSPHSGALHGTDSQ